MENSKKKNTTSTWVTRACVLLFVLFAILYFVDYQLYRDLLREDHLLEWITFFCLLGAGLWGLLNSYLSRSSDKKRAVFFLGFGLVFCFFALEEISWGQRTLALETPEYFLQNSAQPELNLHNLLQGLTDSLGNRIINMKFAVALIVMVYGYYGPRKPASKLVKMARSKGLVFPPKYLGPAFIAATIAMADIPSSHEEELGECIYSICFLVFMGHEYYKIRRPVSSSVPAGKTVLQRAVPTSSRPKSKV